MYGGSSAEVNRWLSRRFIHARRGDLDPPGRGGDLTRPVVAVADHQPTAGLIDLFSVGVEIGAAFGLQRDREHLARGQTTQLVQIHQAAVATRGVGCGVRVVAGGID